MKIVIPIEVVIKLDSSGSKKKDNKRSKEIARWLVNDLKNLYIPVGDDDTCVINKIKVGAIT